MSVGMVVYMHRVSSAVIYGFAYAYYEHDMYRCDKAIFFFSGCYMSRKNAQTDANGWSSIELSAYHAVTQSYRDARQLRLIYSANSRPLNNAVLSHVVELTLQMTLANVSLQLFLHDSVLYRLNLLDVSPPARLKLTVNIR
jgi:hypothetical protein